MKIIKNTVKILMNIINSVNDVLTSLYWFREDKKNYVDNLKILRFIFISPKEI